MNTSARHARATAALIASVVVATAGLTACSSTSKGGPKIAVTSTATECTVARTTLTAGAYTFVAKNGGSSITEIYVYGKKDGSFSAVKGEVENLGPGTSRNVNVTLDAGSYEVTCKPGQKGNGIRTSLTVS